MTSLLITGFAVTFVFAEITDFSADCSRGGGSCTTLEDAKEDVAEEEIVVAPEVTPMGGRLEVISGWRDSLIFSLLVVAGVVASKDVSLLAVLETEKSCNINIERERKREKNCGWAYKYKLLQISSSGCGNNKFRH